MDSENNPRITDYGLLPIFNEFGSTHEDHRGFVTARYTAPELHDQDTKLSLSTHQAADVFAFACVCIEVIRVNTCHTRGSHGSQLYTLKVPFAAVRSDIAVVPRIVRGERPSLPPPDECPFGHPPEGVENVMKCCWEQEPQKRPGMHEVAGQLKNLISSCVSSFALRMCSSDESLDI
jgi:hypothetical protein